jgi:hypothetical protein
MRSADSCGWSAGMGTGTLSKIPRVILTVDPIDAPVRRVVEERIVSAIQLSLSVPHPFFSPSLLLTYSRVWRIWVPLLLNYYHCDHDAQVHEKHIEEVKGTVPPSRLLVYDVKEGWRPLCEFLNVPVRPCLISWLCLYVYLCLNCCTCWSFAVLPEVLCGSRCRTRRFLRRHHRPRRSPFEIVVATINSPTWCESQISDFFVVTRSDQTRGCALRLVARRGDGGFSVIFFFF